MSARNRSVVQPGSGAGPTSGANGQPVAVFYSIVSLSGAICDTVAELQNFEVGLTVVNYV